MSIYVLSMNLYYDCVRYWLMCGAFLFFFFFKQKTAYEMLRSLVGSEMCIRDRVHPYPDAYFIMEELVTPVISRLCGQ